MRRAFVFLAFAGFLAYGAWNGCADTVKHQRAANVERAQMLDSI
jgi:hypothetical protein